jgi:chorismate-pyruvate lyase
MTWENEPDAQRHIPILTEDEELIWSGLGSMTRYLEVEREQAQAEMDTEGWGDPAYD